MDKHKLKMLRIRGRFFVASIFYFILVKINCENTTSNVIIIGAGASGIAAATKLLENNITNIIILEAEGRIGGRIYSVKFGEKIIDLGAQWCHGEEDNVVYNMVKDLHLLESGEFFFNYFHSSHEKIDQTFANELRDLFSTINDDDDDEGKDGLSLGAYITKRYNETIAANYEDSPEKISFASDFLDLLMKETSSLEGSFSWFDVSAASDYKECEGNQILNWKGRGYKTILDVLMKKYPNPANQLPIDDKILLNKEVTRILWDYNPDDPEKVSVKCSDGTVYHGNQVIFTPSLGVLKDRYKTLFHPSLPEEKINAIQELGINAVGKVFLHFPIKWWPTENFSGFNFIWAGKDKQMLLKEFSEGPNENGKSWLTNLMGLYVAESPSLLTAWFVGEFVPQIELCSDELVMEGIMYILNKFVGNQFNITKPDSLMRHGWYSNPHFRGTYSFQTIQSRKREVSAEVVLSQPLTSRDGIQTLLFAGEATHPFHYSTVNGAIETGYREAERIISSNQRIFSN